MSRSAGVSKIKNATDYTDFTDFWQSLTRVRACFQIAVVKFYWNRIMGRSFMSGKAKLAVRNSFSNLNSLLDEAGIQLKTPKKTEPPKPAPVFHPAPNAPNECSDEELFTQSMGGVERVAWRRSPHASAKPFQPPQNEDAGAEDLRLMQAAADKNAPMEILDHPEYIEGWIGVSGKRFIPRLRNGFYSIQGQIDLHGLSREEAQKEVEEYIAQMSRFHSCCIKIIHGRGINSPTDRATLKESLQNLLCTRKMSRHVVAYSSAQFNDGGVGAVYVLLSRQ
jgi:DNA-nicking Smr family endonuclease